MPVVIYMVFRPKSGSVNSAGHNSALTVDSHLSHKPLNDSFSEDRVVEPHSEGVFGEPVPDVSLPKRKVRSGCDEEPVLPGHGDPGKDCGVLREMICRDCGHHFQAERSCMMRECPNCYHKWASKESKVASWRFWTGCKFVRVNLMIPKSKARRAHCVISFRTDGTLDTQRKVAIQTAKEHGILGGLMVYHPFRRDEERHYVPDGYVHFHILGFAKGDIPPGGTDDGIVFKHIPHPDGGDFRGFRSISEVQKCIFYLLTHCGVIKGRHSLTWWGELSYNSLSTQRLDAVFEGRELYCQSRGILCPSCGSRNTEPLMMPHEYGFPSKEPIHHSPGAGVPWGGLNDAL